MIKRLSPPLRIWLLLMALTFGSVALAEELSARRIAIVAIFLIAAVKAELVLDHYMEARETARHWLIMYFIWIIAVTLLLVGGHAW